MLSTRPDIFGLVIELHFGGGPGRRDSQNLLIKFSVLHGGSYLVENPTSATANPGGCLWVEVRANLCVHWPIQFGDVSVKTFGQSIWKEITQSFNIPFIVV